MSEDGQGGAPLLVTRRLELWRPRAGDLAGLHAMMDDAETMRFVGSEVPSQSDSFARLQRNAGSWSLYGYGTFMVRETGQAAIVGSCGVFHSFRGFGAEQGFDDAREAGWMVHRDCWGKGYAGEAMQAALAWFDTEHGPARVVCMIEQGNDASVKLARALGFERFGEQIEGEDTVLGLYARG